jgi:hypothetical protein
MSDGISDAKAEDKLERDVWVAAFDVVDAIKFLRAAISRARMGHRGWTIARGWIVYSTCKALKEIGFELIDREPEKSFEWYEDAYAPIKTSRHLHLERRFEELLTLVDEVSLSANQSERLARLREVP